MKPIPLTQGQVAKVDDEDFDRLNQFKWQAQWNEPTQSYYATRGAYLPNGKHIIIRMHREIMQTPKGMDCDHIHHDTLDNQESELRNCTRSQNVMNANRRKDNASGYKGVIRHGSKWRAQVKKDGKVLFRKQFETPEIAAQAYDTAAKEIFGEFASLNFGRTD